jgi:hypothetical protein
MEHWLAQWSKMLNSARNLQDFPLWLQYFSKIIFLVINKSGELLDVQKFELLVTFYAFCTQSEHI